MDPVTSKITIGELFGNQQVANITIEDAKFWGRPNFSGEVNQFRETKRQFTVIIPNEHAETLRGLGWNVKTKIPTPEEVEKGFNEISSLKVAVDEDIANIFVLKGEEHEKLNAATMGILDRARIMTVDMELRAWMYNKDEVQKGIEEPKFSARLVTLMAVIQQSILGAKYGAII